MKRFFKYPQNDMRLSEGGTVANAGIKTRITAEGKLPSRATPLLTKRNNA